MSNLYQKTKKLKNEKTVFMFFSFSVFQFFSFSVFNVSSYALNLDKAKEYFISGDYKSAIIEGEKVLADSGNASGIDELYYILGLSYLKDGNYLRASDIFEIILKEFKGSSFINDSRLGLGDSYFLRGDFDKAEREYKNLLKMEQSKRLKPSVYYRLSQCAVKLGNLQDAKDYLNKLKQEFPLSVEEQKGNQDCNLSPDFYYSVQVGSFSSCTNANNLTRELTRKGYSAYVEQADQQGRMVYRVKIGKIRARQEAATLESKLSKEGYSTKVCP